MKETLSTIQKLYKAGKILSMIICIASIVGAVSCLVAIIGLAFGFNDTVNVGGVTIKGIVANEAGASVMQMIQAMVEGMITSGAEVVLAWFAKKYFENELKVGTPFTLEGARELKRLGILAIAITLGAQVVSGIVNAILVLVSGEAWKGNVDQSSSVIIGIMFLLMSLLLRYVAEQGEQNKMPEKAGE